MTKYFHITQHLSREDIIFYTKMASSDDTRAHKIEMHLNDCPLCREAVEGFASVPDFEMTDVSLGNIKERLNNIADLPNTNAPISKPKISPIWRYAAAAGVIMLLGAIPFLYQNKVAYEEQLYTENYKHYEDMHLVRRMRPHDKAPSDDDKLQAAMNIYSENNYKGAIGAFHDYLKEDPNNPQASFYLGLSYLEMDSVKEAIEAIKIARMAPSKEDRIYIDSGWYLALAYLKDKNTAQCKVVLQEVINEHGDFAADAKTLLHKLDN